MSFTFDLKKYSGKAATLSLIAALATAFFCHCVYMWVIPLPWADGVQIQEYGRVFLSKSPVEGSLIMNSKGESIVAFSYVGCVLQEIMYKLFGFAGPRLLPMIGLLLAACLCKAWLIKKGFSPWSSGLFACVVLTNPILTQSVRSVRIDTVGLALFFFVVYLMEHTNEVPTRIVLRNFFIAGMGACLSLFVWPTAFVFIPYFLANLWCIHSRNRLDMAKTVRYLLAAIMGASFMGTLGALIVLKKVPMMVAGIFEYMNKLYFHGGTPNWVNKLIVLAYGVGQGIAREVLRDPFLALIILLGFIAMIKHFRRHWVWVIIGMSTICFSLKTGFYIYRLIYLLPFLFLLAYSGFQTIQKRYQRGARTFLGLLLVYGFITSYFIPMAMAHLYRGRTWTTITESLKGIIGDGDKRVYLCSHQLYYSARALNWRIHLYLYDSLFDDEQCAKLLSRMDYVVDNVPSVYSGVVEEGFTFYNLTRDYCIKSAEKHINVPEKQLPSFQKLCVRVGQSVLPFASPEICDAQKNKMEHFLKSKGFEKIMVIDTASPSIHYTPFEQWILSRCVAPTNYAPVIVWKRVNPDDLF
jgi:hypothetical protein